MREEFIKHLQSMTDKEFENCISKREGGCPVEFGLKDDVDLCMAQTANCCLECWGNALK